MRIGGAFPFGIPPIPIAVASGSPVYPPAGQYIITTGPSTVIEWFDQAYQLWRTIIPVSSAGQISVDGFNWRFRNITGQVTVASFTAGSGATNGIGTSATGVTLTPSAPGSNGRTATLFPVVGGQIGSSATITTAGSGLLVPPLLVVQPPANGGITATMTCTISGGAINTVTVTNQGAGYTAIPQVSVLPQLAGYAGSILPSPAVQNYLGTTWIPPAGSAAYTYNWPEFQWPNLGVWTTVPVITAGAITGSGTLTGVVVIDGGSLYTGTPTVTVTGAGAATVTCNAVTAAANDVCYLQPSVNE